MADLLEIRWHARAGQGAVTAAKLLAETALTQGKYIQAFPDYGPERMGAPIRAFTRISERPIYRYCQVTEPDVVIVLDPTIMTSVDVTEGVDETGVILVNTNETAEKLKRHLRTDGARVYTVDATRIALDTMGRNITNTPMLGALLKVVPLMEKDMVLTELKHWLSAEFSPQIVAANLLAFERAYNETQGVDGN